MAVHTKVVGDKGKLTGKLTNKGTVAAPVTIEIELGTYQAGFWQGAKKTAFNLDIPAGIGVNGEFVFDLPTSPYTYKARMWVKDRVTAFEYHTQEGDDYAVVAAKAVIEVTNKVWS